MNSMNRFEDDPEVRRWRRVAAAASIAVATFFITGLAIVAGTTPADRPKLSVNCATEGMPGTVFDDTGTHAALCAGHASFNAGRLQPPPQTSRYPEPSPDAVAEPHPSTF